MEPAISGESRHDAHFISLQRLCHPRGSWGYSPERPPVVGAQYDTERDAEFSTFSIDDAEPGAFECSINTAKSGTLGCAINVAERVTIDHAQSKQRTKRRSIADSIVST